MITNKSLTACRAYQESEGKWYLELVYEYESEKGIHEIIYPKVELPYVMCHELPSVVNRGIDDLCTLKYPMPICDYGTLRLLKGNVTTDEHYYKDVLAIDYLKVLKVHEMTLEEIEKELGYSVKIISKNKEKEQNVTC